MTATSVLQNTMNTEPIFKYTQGTFLIDHAYQRFSHGAKTPVNNPNMYDTDPNVMNFVSDETKVFITVFNGMYHFWHDTMGPFLYQLEKTPDALFIFDTINLWEPDDKFIDILRKMLVKRKINHRFIKTSEDLKVIANNFYAQNSIDDGANAGERVYKFITEDVVNKDVKPFRKVYLSRANQGKRNNEDRFVDGPSFKNDNRIDDEAKLEKFFASLGFEIIVPEIHFKTLEDQINYFYEAETIIHLTGGGGTNSMFMQPRGNVIEITTSMVVQTGESKVFPGKYDVEEAIHHFYAALAFNRDHNYIAIQNKTRSADLLIKEIQTNKVLQSIFKGVFE